jgi:hypothetical protein
VTFNFCAFAGISVLAKAPADKKAMVRNVTLKNVFILLTPVLGVLELENTLQHWNGTWPEWRVHFEFMARA